MKQKYTYQDWLDDKKVPIPLERVQYGDIFLKMVRENILSKEDYRKIKEKQEWTYKKSVKNYSNYCKSELGTRLQFSEFPDDLYLYEIEELKERKEEYSEYLGEILREYYDFNFISGYEYQRAKNGNVASPPSIRKYPSLENGNFILATTLNILKELQSKSMKAFLSKWGDKKETTRGRKKSEELTLDKTKELIEEFMRSKAPQSKKIKSDGSLNKYQIKNFIFKKDLDVSESTIKRRVEEAIEKWGQNSFLNLHN